MKDCLWIYCDESDGYHVVGECNLEQFLEWKEHCKIRGTVGRVCCFAWKQMTRGVMYSGVKLSPEFLYWLLWLHGRFTPGLPLPYVGILCYFSGKRVTFTI